MTSVIEPEPLLSSPASRSARPRSARGQATVRRDLRSIMLDGIFFSLMVGLGEAYFSAYALALGLSPVIVGLIATVPLLAGAVLQLIAPYAVVYFGSHRRWVVICAATQTISLSLLPLAALLGSASGWFLSGMATLYWASSLAGGPSWNTWVEYLVPRGVRTRFFADRVRRTQAGVLAGFALAGLTLQAGARLGHPLLAFSALFVAASLFRLVSTLCLARQSEPATSLDGYEHVQLFHWLKTLPASAGGRLLIYMLAVQVAVQMSGPYFTPYMLGEMKMSYFQYMLLLGVAYLGKIAALPALGRFSSRYGARKLLWLGGVGIVPVAGLWLFSQSFWYLVCIQLLSGTVWAAYELATLLMFFEAIPKAQRTSILTFYNLANAMALVGGALVGGGVLSLLGPAPETYLVLFVLSSTVRAGTLLLLRQVPTPVHTAAPPATRTISIRVASGSEERPILSTLPANESQAA